MCVRVYSSASAAIQGEKASERKWSGNGGGGGGGRGFGGSSGSRGKII